MTGVSVAVIPGSPEQLLIQELIQKYHLNAKCAGHTSARSDDFFPSIRVPASASQTYPVSGLVAVVFYLLTTAASDTAAALLGSEPDQPEILQWSLLSVNQVHIAEVASEQNLSVKPLPVVVDINNHLKDRTYLVGNRLSIADILLCHSLWPIVKEFQPKAYRQASALTRWFDLVQTSSGIRSRPSISFQLNYFFDNTPVAPLQLAKAPAAAQPKAQPQAETPAAKPTPGAKAEPSKQAAPKQAKQQ